MSTRNDPFDTPAMAPGPWFYANYAGECTTCGGEFDEGDRIRATGTGGYECEDCEE